MDIDEQRKAADDRAWEDLQAKRVDPASDEPIQVMICKSSGGRVYPYHCNTCNRTECRGRVSYKED